MWACDKVNTFGCTQLQSSQELYHGYVSFDIYHVYFLSCCYLHVQYQEPWVLLCQHFGVGTPEFPMGMCLFHAGDEDFGQEHCTKMFPTWWAASASNSAAVSLYCCLLQCCPLPILPFLPKENAHWRADSSAQWRALLKLVLTPGLRVLSRHEQEWMALVMNVQPW